MSRDRRPARSDVPRRTPGELVDALRDLAADAEEPVLSARRRFMRPAAVSEPAADPTTSGELSALPDPAPDVGREQDAPTVPVAQGPADTPPPVAHKPDLLWRRPEPAHAGRPPGRARRDRATVGLRPSAGAGRTRAGLNPLRLGGGALGAAVIVIILASVLGGGSSKKPASHHAAKAGPLPSTTIAAPAAVAPKRIRHRATSARLLKRAHGTTSRRRPAGPRHRHPARAAHTTAKHHRHPARAAHATAKHHRHRTRARRHRRRHAR